jgi:putative ABC transport system ATP-binding protein
LHQVGLGNRLHHRPGQLSGGEQQRVAIAAALVNNPTLLLADEPTGELDSATAADIIDLLVGLNRERGMTIVLVTHNLALAGRADRAVKMLDGLLAEFDPHTPLPTPDVGQRTSAPHLGSSNAPPVVEATGLTKSFPGGVLALRGVSLAVHSGETLSVMGPSGCGKSTLLSLLGGLDRPTSGRVAVGGRELNALSARELAHVRRHDIGFVFQAHNLLATLTATENVALPLVINGVPEALRRERSLELIERVGLGEHANKLPDQLSGGQRQRVAIARGLANSPNLLLADEPTGNLDSESAASIVGLLSEVCHEQGVALVLVTHDRQVAAKSDRVLQLRDGQVVLSATPGEDG